MNIFHLCVHVCLVASVMFDSVRPYRLQPARLLCLWDFPGKNTGVDCHAFLQGIFLTQGLNPCLLLSCIADGFFTHWATWKGIFLLSGQFSSVLSPVWLFATPWTATPQACLSITNSWSLLKLTSIKLVMPSKHLILCCPFLFLPSIFPSSRVFSNKSVLHIRWPKCWSFSFSISPFNEYLGSISLRTDWLDLLVVQGTLKSLLQHHSSKASILWHSAFFKVQLSHPCMATGKTITLTRWTFVGKVMSLLFNMLSRLVIAFLPRSKRLLISRLQSPSAGILFVSHLVMSECLQSHGLQPAWRLCPWNSPGKDIGWVAISCSVILEPKKIKSLTVSIVSPSICH